MFSGDNTPDQLARWRSAGTSAGRALGELGSIGISAFQALIPLVKEFMTWVGSLSGEDIRNGITGLIDGFKTVASVFKGVYEVGKAVYNIIKGIVDLAMGVGSFVGDFVSNIGEAFGSGENTLMGALAPPGSPIQRARFAAARENEGNINFNASQDYFSGAINALSGNYFALDTGRQQRKQSADYSPEGGFVAENVAEQANKRYAPQIASYKQWFETKTKDWHGAGNAGQSFGEDSQWMQEKYINEFNRLIDALEKLGAKPYDAKIDIETLRAAVAKGDEAAKGRTYAHAEGNY